MELSDPDMLSKGKLTIIHGPMFAGKSTALIDRARTFSPDSFLAFKPQIDTRYSATEIVTHAQDALSAIPVFVENPQLLEFIDDDIQTVVVDELNFFSFEPIWSAIQQVLYKGVDVIGAGLLTDFLRKPFGATMPLLNFADEVVELYSRCDYCGQAAQYSFRKVDQDDQFLLGAADKYGACCEACWK